MGSTYTIQKLNFLKSRARALAKRNKSHIVRLKKWQSNNRVKRLRQEKLRTPYDHPAPKIFSLIQNPDEILEYFAKGREILHTGKSVSFNLEQIEVLTSDAIALLIATIRSKKYSRGVKIEGLPPQKPELFKMLVSSGFYKFVTSKMPNINKTKHLFLHTVTRNKVENKLAKHASALAVKHSFGNKKKFRPIYEILIESMANTNNHADTSQTGKYDWWLFVYFDEVTRITKFTFLDLGIGVFNSIPVQSFKALAVVIGSFTMISFIKNTSLVDDLFNGKISSRTGLGERGQGFPLIYEHSKHPLIQNFYLVSNDVYSNLKTGEKRDLRTGLTGTLLSWELHPETEATDDTN